MGWRSLLCGIGILWAPIAGCHEAEAPPDRIEVASEHRSCEEGDACAVVETSCTSRGCECGVAVNEAHLLDYQKQLAECRGQRELATCDFQCETPFAKCFEGACVLTSEPQELFRRGRSVQALCEGSRGSYVGCPKCPPNQRCKSCNPCECPSSHRWTSKGCRAVVQTEAREIQVEARPPRLTFDDKIKARVTNESKRKIWLKTVCGTPFYRVRKKEDEWETQYDAFRDRKCRLSSVEIAPGSSRHFVIDNLDEFEDPSGASLLPGTYRFELTYTDGTDSFRYHALVYSVELELVPKLSRR
ncbi:MAG: hypothetical protein WAU39_14265 [Polyangiales bacterium]